MSDLLNPPGRVCACEGAGCREASAWAEGPIVERVRARVKSETRFWGRAKPIGVTLPGGAARPGEANLVRLAGDLA